MNYILGTGALAASGPMFFMPLAIASEDWIKCAIHIFVSVLLLATTHTIMRLSSRARLGRVLVLVWAMCSAFCAFAPAVPVLIGVREYSQATAAALWLGLFFVAVALSILLPAVFSKDRATGG